MSDYREGSGADTADALRYRSPSLFLINTFKRRVCASFPLSISLVRSRSLSFSRARASRVYHPARYHGPECTSRRYAGASHLAASVSSTLTISLTLSLTLSLSLFLPLTHTSPFSRCLLLARSLRHSRSRLYLK